MEALRLPKPQKVFFKVKTFC